MFVRGTALLLLLASVSCRRSQGDPREGTGIEERAAVTLRLQSILGGEERERADALFAAYNRGQTRIRVVHEVVSPGMAADLMRTQISSGRPADLYWFALGELVGPLIDAGRVLDLTPLYARHRWNERMVPWADAYVMRGGKRWAVPRVIRGLGFWYRVDLFRRHGLAVPTSYGALETACERLAAAGVACLSLGGRFGWNTMRLLDYFLESTAGPELHDRLNRRELGWNRPEVIAAYARLRRWVERGFLMPNFLTISPEDARLPFYKGDAAMVFEGDWFEAVAHDDEQPADRFDYFVPPTDREPLRVSGWTETMFAPAATQHPDEVAAFLDWMLSDETQRSYFAGSSALSARAGIVPDEGRRPRLARWRRDLERLSVYPPTDQVFPRDVMDRFLEIQDQVIAGRLSPEQAAAAFDGALARR